MNDLVGLSKIVCTQHVNVDTMLKDPQSPRYAQRRTHHSYPPQFKAELVAMRQNPGASIAAVALQHGINANLLHRWRKEWTQGLHRREGGITTAVATPQTPAFIPIELSTAASITASEQSSVAASTPATDIRIECQRPGMNVTLWPAAPEDINS